MKFFVTGAIFASLSLSTYASVTPKTLTSTLTKSDVDTTQIGCKCIMTAPTTNNTDSTACLCYNRKDGTLNDSDKCSKYTDAVFEFCTKATETTSQWQECAQYYCPTASSTTPPPVNQLTF